MVLGTSRPFGIQARPRQGQSGQAWDNSALPDLLAQAIPSANIWNGALGGSIIATTPPPVVPGDVAIADHIGDEVTAYLALNPGSPRRAALVWAGCNDALHYFYASFVANPSLTSVELLAALGTAANDRLDAYLAALVAAGVQRIVVCTETPAPEYLGGPGVAPQDAFDTWLPTFNAHILALSDPRIIVADLANAPGLVLAADGLHYTDYTPHASFLLPYVEEALA